uniref:Uncharacterized protein n=1 Tax=Tetradesmus obliquus TaxID=3088 RepID=A0A383VL69_TETOB|eukprot:jgi/Sobl393_1/16289/SZX65673.1
MTCLHAVCVAGLSSPLQQQALQAQMRAQVLAGATQHGMHGLQAAAAARPPPQQLHVQTTTASSAGIAGLPLHKQQQETAADADFAAAEDCRSLSSSKPDAGSGNGAACVNADIAAEQAVP